jgi:hypothetical protein
MRKLSSSRDRAALIKLASRLPAGSSERRAILSGLVKQAKRLPKSDLEEHELSILLDALNRTPEESGRDLGPVKAEQVLRGKYKYKNDEIEKVKRRRSQRFNLDILLDTLKMSPEDAALEMPHEEAREHLRKDFDLSDSEIDRWVNRSPRRASLDSDLQKDSYPKS